jgi:hypothetical protein
MTRVGLTSTSFWIDTTERSVRAFGQGVLTSAGLGFADLGLSVPWHLTLIAGGVFSVLTCATCLASLIVPKADPDTGSFLAIPPYQLITFKHPS